MTDEDAIRRLTFRYSDAVSRRDAREAAAVYLQDGVLSAFDGPDIIGRAAIEAALAAVLDGLAFILQTSGNGLIDVHGDTAQARWGVTEIMQRTDAIDLSHAIGLYEDTLVRDGGGWHFRRRRYHPMFLGRTERKGKTYPLRVMEHIFQPQDDHGAG